MNQSRPQIAKYVFAIIAGLSLGSCTDKPEPSTPAESKSETLSEAHLNLEQANTATFSAFTEAAKLSYSRAKALENAVDQFLVQPSPERLEAAQSKWFDLENALSKLDFFNALASSSPQFFDEFNRSLYRIQAHPIQPGYLDRFGVYEYSGLVYDVGFPITAQSLLQQHGLTDKEEALLGLYAIEFMLFGSEGNRPIADYLAFDSLQDKHIETGIQNINEIPENRRRKLLTLQTKQLVTDLNDLQSNVNTTMALTRWQNASPNRQISSIRRALENSLTEFLIALANFQKALNERQNSDLPSPELSMTASANIQKALIKLESIKPAANYLSPLESEALLAAIENSAGVLNNQAVLNNEDADAAKTALQSVYEQIKNLL